tara:strand:+ start:116 stop:325 length:210 start_codon:yes stop_codon:yes gene_type:complete
MENKIKILKCKDVLQITSLSTSTMYRMIQENRFPAPIKLSTHAAGWIESEVYEWIRSQMDKRGQTNDHT